MPNFLLSDNVVVFPSVRRDGKYQNTSRIMSEYTSTLLTRTLSSSGGFVISENFDLNFPVVEFILNGYYFKITIDTTQYLTGDSLFVSLVGDSTANDETSYQLKGDSTTDNKSYYNGLDVSSTKPQAEHYLLLLQKVQKDNSATWVIPDSSKERFSSYQIGNLDEIDGGEV